MRDRESTHPFVFFFLVLPYGISSGFVSITLPFVLTRVGFSVALAASIVDVPSPNKYQRRAVKVRSATGPQRNRQRFADTPMATSDQREQISSLASGAAHSLLP
jgi:hypothetical protein